MKLTTKISILATVMSLAAVQAWADSTNLVRNLDIQFVGLQQGKATTARNVTTTTVDRVQVDTTDVINALATATGNKFSPAARLVVITPLSFGPVTIAVRDRGNSVDVSAFLVQSSLSDSVGKSTVNTKTGKASGSDYSYQKLVLQDVDGYTAMPLHYVVTGVAIENFSVPAIPGPRSELNADVSGAGDSGGNLLILGGTIRISGQSIEVVPGFPGGPPA